MHRSKPRTRRSSQGPRIPADIATNAIAETVPPRVSEQPRPGIWRNLACVILAVCVLAMAFIYGFFMDRAPEFDELVLGNPIHMYLHSARMTYPAHGYPEYMVVHPPTHYVLIGNIMRTGLDMFHAAAVPVFFFVLVSVLVLLTGPFSFEVKLGLMAGLYCGLFVWGHFRPVRPDLHVAAAWFCGLVFLESARLTGWHPIRLAAGAFLVTYASGLHYPGSFAFLSGVIYAAWCLWDLGGRRAWRRVVLMGIAAGLFAVPYVLLFAWPLLPEIRLRVAAELAMWTPPWVLHIRTYSAWWNHPELPGAFHAWKSRPFTALLTVPLFALRVPAAIVAPILLFMFPTTRGIAVAAVPHLMFLLFFAGGRGKNETNTGYYAAEVTLYLSAACVGLVWLMGRAPRLGQRLRANTPAALIPSLFLSAAVLTDVPNSISHRFALVSRPGYEDVLRAAGHEILGPGAAIASASPTMWYHSGAELYYFLTPDLLYPDDISGVDYKKYFSHFDAVGLSPQESGLTWNRQHKSVSEWYTEGDLRLRGFVLANGMLSYLLATPQKQRPVIGFCYDAETKHLWKFVEGPNANAVLVAFTGTGNRIASEPLLNDRTWGYQSFGMAAAQRALLSDQILQIVLLPKAHFDEAAKVLERFHLVEEFAGQVTPVNPEDRLRALDQGRWPLEIPRTLAEVDALRARPLSEPITPNCEILAPSARLLKNGIRHSAYRSQYDLVARSHPLSVVPGNLYRVSFTLAIHRGGVAINVMSPDLREYRLQMLRHYPQKPWREGFVFTAKDTSVVLTIGVYNQQPGPSSFEVQELRIQPVNLR